MSASPADLLAALDALPRETLGRWPTPVRAWPALLPSGGPVVYVKRDDQSGEEYGGNKVRKLEYLLSRARARGARRLLTAGYAGSNHALATVVYGRRLGFAVTALLLPQLNAPYVRENLCRGFRLGAELVHCRHTPALVLAGLMRLRQGGVAIIPPGGSSPLGNVGYVRAGLELAGQIAAGDCPAPARVYVPLGSMGTAAGLAIGLAAAGLPSRVVAVRVTETRYASATALRRLIGKTQRFLRRRLAGWPDVAPEVRVVDGFFGGQYAQVTPAAAAAVARAAAAGLKLETTYSGKAMAALLADAEQEGGGETWLFWHTYNGRPAPDEGAVDYRALPVALHPYFEVPDGVRP